MLVFRQLFQLSLASIPFAKLVAAQDAEYAQCGGIGFTGSTVCDSPYTCQYINDYFFQCLPAVSTTSSATSTTSAPASTSTGFAWSNIVHFISFGDSYSQTGFDYTSSLANQYNILGNPAFPGWTSDGGLNWIDYLIAVYNQTVTLSYNYASGGATISRTLATPCCSTSVCIDDQINDQYLTTIGETGQTLVDWSANDSLFAIFDGVNDVLDTYWNTTNSYSVTLAPFFDLYASLVDELYASGARNFLFVGVPALDLTPEVADNGAEYQAWAKSDLETWNSNLQTLAANLKAAHSDVTTFYADLETLWRDIYADPQAYGLNSTAEMWYDAELHPTQTVQMYMAQTIVDVLTA